MKMETSVWFKHLISTTCFIIFLSNNSWAALNDNDSVIITEDDRRLLLGSISKNVMLPIFKELNLNSNTLVKHTESFCQDKTETTLIALRNSWAETANTWAQTDSLLFGPTVDDNIDFSVYFSPIKKMNIKALLNKANLALEDIESAGVATHGLGTLEYFLFSRELSLSEVKQRFVNDLNTCNYLLKITELLNRDISTISRQWFHYGVQFGLAGNNSLFFIESNEAMDLLVNKIYQASQKISNKKVGLLSNKKKINKSTSYKLHAWRSGSSLGQIKANVIGIKRIFDDGKVLQWLIANNKVQIAEELTQVIKEILNQKIEKNDLFTVLQTSPEGLQALVANTQKLTELIKTKLAPSLGVQLGFNDNDGD